jgi:hypothetical protein
MSLTMKRRMAVVAVTAIALGGMVSAQPAAASAADCPAGYICLYIDGRYSGTPHLYTTCGCHQNLRAADHDEISSWINRTDRNVSLGYNIPGGSHLSTLTPGQGQAVVWQNDAADFLIS